jgi:hypothetical protein
MTDNLQKGLSSYLPYFSLSAIILAVVFDVGAFTAIGIGQFSLFSISEHGIFALEAMPYIFSGMFLVLIYSAVANYIMLKRHQRIPIDQRLLLFVNIIVASFMVSQIYEKNYYFAAAFAGLLVVLFGATFITLKEQHKLLSIPAICLGTTLTVFSLGFQYQQYVLKLETHRYALRLKTGTEISGSMLKSGERGILFFDQATKTIQFFRWDSIDKVTRNTQDLL